MPTMHPQPPVLLAPREANLRAEAAAAQAPHEVDEPIGPLGWVALVFLILLVLGAVRGAIMMRRRAHGDHRRRRWPLDEAKDPDRGVARQDGERDWRSRRHL